MSHPKLPQHPDYIIYVCSANVVAQSILRLLLLVLTLVFFWSRRHLCSFRQGGAVVVLRFGVDDEVTVNKEVGVRCGSIWRHDHLDDLFFRQFWDVVNELPGVCGVRDAERKGELVRLY